jgi:maltooligosyltrehalose trehalohydrolase
MINELTVERRALGVSFRAGVAEVLIWAPACDRVALQADGQDPLPLTQKEFGYWYLSTPKLRAGMPYRFMLNDEPVADVTSLYQPEGVHGASQTVDPANFSWTDDGWHNLPLNDYLLYELHTGTFTPEGNFSGIARQLDYLMQLGITAIELMPVAQFPGERNWGYDGVFPFAVQNSYGGPEGLQQLVNLCHQKGIAVVLDVVYNHMGPEGNYLTKYGPYFTAKYKTPWGDALNFDDAGCDAVRRYFIENALMWFRDFHIDALRLDAVHAIKDFSPKHILRELRERVDELMQLTGRSHYLIIECDLNDRRFIDPVAEDGYGMDAQWTDEFHHALRVTAGGGKTGYYSDFNAVSSLAAAYRHAYVYHGQYSAHRDKKFGTVTDNAGGQFIVFSQNHDQIGNRMLGERSSQLYSFGMQKLLAGAVMVSPFLPLLFMGEEFSAPSPFQYFVSHTDPDLIAAVQQGRKEEFAAFHSQGEAPDPQASETFERSKLSWDQLVNGPHRTMLNYYRSLIALRKKERALNSNDRNQLDIAFNEDTQVITLYRWEAGEQLTCYLNFSARQRQVPFQQSGEGQKCFDSAAKEWGGFSTAPQRLSPGTMLLLQPESLLIYKHAHV